MMHNYHHISQISNKLRKGIVMVLVLIVISACTQSNDKPPALNTPLPPAHDGVYVSQDAQFTFNGDGKTVFVTFSERYRDLLDQAPNDSKYHYTFTWYDFGEYRYDGATNLILFHEESKTSLDFNLLEAASFESIQLSFPNPDKTTQILKRITD
jgi:hypothetical protein